MVVLAGSLAVHRKGRDGRGKHTGRLATRSAGFMPLMSFGRPPLTAMTAAQGIIIHTAYAPGNYCYDGTACTYEASEPPGFLCFADPHWAEESGLD